MEKRIQLSTRTTFKLSSEEMERLYTAMALVTYRDMRNPDYKEGALLRRLCYEFGRYNHELDKTCKNDPNNLVLSQIRVFVQRHYGYLKTVAKEFPPQV